jgi:hypothetical protein
MYQPVRAGGCMMMVLLCLPISATNLADCGVNNVMIAITNCTFKTMVALFFRVQLAPNGTYAKRLLSLDLKGLRSHRPVFASHQHRNLHLDRQSPLLQWILCLLLRHSIFISIPLDVISAMVEFAAPSPSHMPFIPNLRLIFVRGNLI